MVNAEYPVQVSTALMHKARRKIEQLKLSQHIEFITDYLTDKEILDLLAESDLIVFPYQQTGESSSAAAHYGLATGRPIAVTPLPIFNDINQAVLKLPGFSPTAIAQGLTKTLHQLKEDTVEVQDIKKNADRWRKTHSYFLLSHRLYEIIQALHRKQTKSLFAQTS
jgi:glycosyltransferase involved in cell wall biosynthesis